MVMNNYFMFTNGPFPLSVRNVEPVVNGKGPLLHLNHLNNFFKACTQGFGYISVRRCFLLGAAIIMRGVSYGGRNSKYIIAVEF